MLYFEKKFAKTKIYYFRENGDNDHFRLNSQSHCQACPTNSTFLFICKNDETPVFVLLYTVLYNVYPFVCAVRTKALFDEKKNAFFVLTFGPTPKRIKKRAFLHRTLALFQYHSQKCVFLTFPLPPIFHQNLTLNNLIFSPFFANEKNNDNETAKNRQGRKLLDLTELFLCAILHSFR